ncbi:hypothetical protein DYB34_003449 [Aphanomyces astaci]|uniref:Uncharacterized protein n=1 Tax=Aphanomyces astaci TaxID=112090 RepID=A0A418CGK2_APHAT|nr:hypothetical protein DYB34_003449 [Aphanomyces astaci]
MGVRPLSGVPPLRRKDIATKDEFYSLMQTKLYAIVEAFLAEDFRAFKSLWMDHRFSCIYHIDFGNITRPEIVYLMLRACLGAPSLTVSQAVDMTDIERLHSEYMDAMTSFRLPSQDETKATNGHRRQRRRAPVVVYNMPPMSKQTQLMEFVQSIHKVLQNPSVEPSIAPDEEEPSLLYMPQPPTTQSTAVPDDAALAAILQADLESELLQDDIDDVMTTGRTASTTTTQIEDSSVQQLRVDNDGILERTGDVTTQNDERVSSGDERVSSGDDMDDDGWADEFESELVMAPRPTAPPLDSANPRPPLETSDVELSLSSSSDDDAAFEAEIEHSSTDDDELAGLEAELGIQRPADDMNEPSKGGPPQVIAKRGRIHAAKQLGKKHKKKRALDPPDRWSSDSDLVALNSELGIVAAHKAHKTAAMPPSHPPKRTRPLNPRTKRKKPASLDNSIDVNSGGTSNDEALAELERELDIVRPKLHTMTPRNSTRVAALKPNKQVKATSSLGRPKKKKALSARPTKLDPTTMDESDDSGLAALDAELNQ